MATSPHAHTAKPAFSSAEAVMRYAVSLAERGRGFVEPNPCVGAVVVDEQLRLIGEGFHREFGGPHAEVHALRAAGESAQGNTLFVTLEPCNHTGKTPPCTGAILQAGISKVVIGCRDPADHQQNRTGISVLRDAGLQVEVGLLEAECRQLIAPFSTLRTQGRPYVHAKWAMSLDGKLATRTKHSQWISSPTSRRLVHQLRGRMDAIIVGSGTAKADDPLLTARPAGPRVATRLVVGSNGDLDQKSQLVRTAAEFPTLLACAAPPNSPDHETLTRAGVEILYCPGETGRVDLKALLAELGRRQMTNLLVEGGGELLGSFFDQQLIDEVHTFIAPKLIGGREAVTPLLGNGLAQVSSHPQLRILETRHLEGDLYLRGVVFKDTDA